MCIKTAGSLRDFNKTDSGIAYTVKVIDDDGLSNDVDRSLFVS